MGGRWHAYVRGGESALAALSLATEGAQGALYDFQGGEVSISHPEWDLLDDPATVAAAASKLLVRLSALARLGGRLGDPLVLQGRYRDLKTGTHHVLVDDVALASDSVLGAGPAGAAMSQRGASGAAILSLADVNVDVDDLLRVLGTSPELNASDLYKAFEVVRHSMGGEKSLIASGLATKDDLSAFTASVNRPDVLGDDARHLRVTGGMPARTLTLQGAREFLLALASRWLSMASTGR